MEEATAISYKIQTNKFHTTALKVPCVPFFD